MKNILALSEVLLSVTSPVALSGDNVSLAEVMLTAPLDESRGYCLDIAGGKGANAPLDKGLQAHTCYNYTGAILEDQGFDTALLSQGAFRIDYFDVCMSASAIKAGASLDLKACEPTETQTFSLKANGQLSPNSDPSLCVTVDSEN
ncbi:RICIN domain-containing protein [Enterovibrio calviensis]|uniref:RICIN domain-containing protein n=1 Tax=Enterovibrio calviensis TaxID=91359 RepID=UPI000A424508|nr:RICIN domain-containing protein [Enterovibrio calviensis]